jgi:quinol monooxygenase YgiN
MRAARSSQECFDFHLSADPIAAARINIFEQWDSVESVETFHGSGSSDEQRTTINEASLSQHEIAVAPR